MPPDPLAALRDTVLDDSLKGIPPGAAPRLGELAEQGWNVARGDLSYPVTTLRRSALDANLRTMARYCARHGAWQAPHGKTTMAPQLFAEQLAHGAWAISAATPTQLAVMRRYRVPRVLLANQVTDASALRWIARETSAAPGFEVLVLADDAEVVAWTDRVLAEAGARTPLPVLVELGAPGGRCGARDEPAALAVAAAVRAAPNLRLAGVECYEGTVATGPDPAAIAAVDALLHAARALTASLLARDWFETGTVLVSAGGSAYFDRVTAILGAWPDAPRPVRLVLRPGCALTHDSGLWARVSPLDGRRPPDEPLRLVNALETWARVLSRPEPGLVVLGAGKRDIGADSGLPTPLRTHGRDDTVTPLTGRAEIRTLMDQHAVARIDETLPLTPGDLVVLGPSHPCTAFDRHRFLPVVDDAAGVVDGVLTFF